MLRMILWILVVVTTCFCGFARSALADTAAHRFRPADCELEVAFPGKPNMTSVVVPDFGEIPEAAISDHRGLMRANCISVSSHGLVQRMPYYEDRQLLVRTVQAYVEQNDLTNVSYSYDKIDLGIRASARGTKQIDGRWVTYETVWFVSPRSVMSLTTGHFSESYLTRYISRFLGSIIRDDHSGSDTSSESSFVTLKLPTEVAIDVPRDWWILNDTANRLIRTSREAVLDLRGITTSEDEEAVLVAANSWPPVTYAALRVTRVQPPLAAPDEIRDLSRSEVSGLGKTFETEMRQALPLQGLTFLETMGIEVEEVGGWPAIIFSYRRSGPKGPVSVQLIQVIRSQDFLRINLSFREGERALWMPVITRIRNSIWAG